MRAAEISSLFSQLVDPDDQQSWPAGRTVGLEHEFEVWSKTGRVDFRQIVHALGLGVRHLDPADPNAYRLASGTTVTADEAEAEFALPPLTVAPGFAGSLAAAAAHERRNLEDLLGPDLRLTGYSTHLSVAAPRRHAEAATRLYAITFASALMLLMNRSDSPGLLLRPRPGRVELGAEHVEGRALAVAALFAVGSVRACLNHVTASSSLDVERVKTCLTPDNRRYGWFIGRGSYGGDLSATGRATELPTRRGGSVTAQIHLERCWRTARSALGSDATLADLEMVDATVFGSGPLPRQLGSDPHDDARLASVAGAPEPDRAFGSMLKGRRRSGYDVVPIVLSWERAVFVVNPHDRSRPCFANVPGPRLGAFRDLLDSGCLDTLLAQYRTCTAGGRRLDERSRAATGLFDVVASRGRLLSPERYPARRRQARRAVAAHLEAVGSSIRGGQIDRS